MKTVRRLAVVLESIPVVLAAACLIVGALVFLTDWIDAKWLGLLVVLAVGMGTIEWPELMWRKRRRRLREYLRSEGGVDDLDESRLELDGTAAAFEALVQRALEALPPYLRDYMSNVELVIEDEPPAGESLLGRYQGVPLTHRGPWYAAVAPDKITIYRGPLERSCGGNRTVLHEVAHHFGISDQRLIEIDRY
jgi:predicted Zn-dependent protease with MMP-like domain